MAFFVAATNANQIKDDYWIYLTDDCYPLAEGWEESIKGESLFTISDKLDGPGIYSKYLLGEYHGKLYNMAGSKKPVQTSLNPAILGEGETTNLIDSELTKDTLLLFGERGIEALARGEAPEVSKEPVIEEVKSLDNVHGFLPAPETGKGAIPPENIIPISSLQDTLKSDFPCFVLEVSAWNKDTDTWDKAKHEIHCSMELAQILAWACRRIGYSKITCYERETEISVPFRQLTNLVDAEDVQPSELMDIPVANLKWANLKQLYTFLRSSLGVKSPQKKRRQDVELEVVKMKKVFLEETVGRERMVSETVRKHG